MSAIPAPMGDPAALDLSVERYAATTLALEAAAAQMERALRDSEDGSDRAGGEGLAMGEVRSRGARTSRALRAAEERYGAVTSALRDYSVELHAFHQATRRSHADYATARADHSSALWRVREERTRLREASMSPDQPHLVEEARAELAMADAAAESAAEALAAAEVAYERAEEALNEAAAVAQARIEGGFDATEDGLLDYALDVWDSAVGLIDAVDQWAAEFLARVLQVVVDAVERVLLAVAFVLVAVALLAVLIVAVHLITVAIAVIAAALAVALAVIVDVLRHVLFVVTTGAVASALSGLLGLEGAARLRVVVAAVGVVCPPLGLFIVERVRSEIGRPTPEVEGLDASAVEGASAAAAIASLNTAPIDDVADVLSRAGWVDTVGGSDRAVVDVVRVVGSDGVVRWIVTLPSTKDWDLPMDLGAPNDLDADLILMLFPDLQTQYERAVLEAMRLAGIGPQDEVLLAGWSLGGILGGSLIESGAGGYHYAGLICAGASIDGMAIPPDIPVLQVKHVLDPVHRADLIERGEVTDTHLELWDGARSGAAAVPIKTGNVVGHANADYVATLTQHLAYDPAINDLFDQFWVSPAEVPALLPGGSDPDHANSEHRQYAFSE